MPTGGRLERLLRDGVFCVTGEAVPPRSADPSGLIAQVEALRGAVDAVNLTDNPASRVHMSPVAGAAFVARAGLEPTLQLTCRDRNRMGLSSDLLGAWALGARNVLCLSGDPAGRGDHPEAAAVFDIDVLGLIRLARMLRDEGRLLSGDPIEEPPRYLVGVAEAPLLPAYDYGRLEAKLDAGARFVQTQMVFDLDAFAAWMVGAGERGILDRVHVLAGVAVLKGARSARFMRDNLPGVTVPDEVIDRLEAAGSEASAEGVRIAAELIAKLRAVPGLAGVHVMGLGHPETTGRVVDEAGLLPRPA